MDASSFTRTWRERVSEREGESSSLNHIRVLISFVKAEGEGHSAVGEKRQGLINRDVKRR